jgi:large subunit ribosomal protein L3
MFYGILGRKKRMTRVFLDSGRVVPVTLIECQDNVVSQVKTQKKDGYSAVTLKSFPVAKPTKCRTHYVTREIRVDGKVEGVEVGMIVSIADLKAGDMVKLVGTSKGKGFQGGMKRHNFAGGPASHGSKFHRAVGSMGTMKPNHTLKGKKMPGRMGCDKITLFEREVVYVDIENKIVAVKGSVPGGPNSFVSLYVS